MASEKGQLTSAKAFLLNHVKDQDLIDALTDISLCNIKKVIGEITPEDLAILAPYFDFPRSRNGGFNLKGARQIIENQLNTYPSFRSQDSGTVCLSIATYYKEHPEEAGRKRTSNSPQWARQYLSGGNVIEDYSEENDSEIEKRSPSPKIKPYSPIRSPKHKSSQEEEIKLEND